MALYSGSGKILMLDNFDSFTYNLVHLLEKNSAVQVEVIRNDVDLPTDLSVYSGVVLSPGPGLPEESGNLMELVDRCVKEEIKVLGVCLGLQAMNNYFGGRLINMGRVHHGIALPVRVVKKDILFKGMNETFPAGRYHSWLADPDFFSDQLELTATGPEGEIMALRHKVLPLFGIQFHPESVLTPSGEILLQNWIFYGQKSD